ncbi:MAG: allophanate hydrolase subunit 1 [Planctomycetota bacterium]
MEMIGESCLFWRLGTGPSLANTQRVHRAYRRLERARAEGQFEVHDVVPAYDSLAIHFDPLAIEVDRLQAQVETWLDETENDDQDHDDAAAVQTVTLPVNYDGPDLQRVADHAGLSREEVVARHTTPTYTVAAIGFMPHFPYLLGLDPSLATPRLASPRVRVSAGAVGIGGDQTGVYPQDSPGGWNLIGTTDPERLQALRPGDHLRFAASEGGV